MNATQTLLSIAILLVGASESFAEEAAKKTAVPNDADQAKATKLIKEVYGNEYASAKTLAEKHTLAKELFDKAEEATEPQAEKFVLLKLARDVAIQAVDGPIAFQAIDSMAGAFQVDAISMKTDALGKLATTALSPGQHKSLLELALALLDDAIALDNLTAASQLCEICIAEARKSHDKELVAKAQSRIAQANEMIKAYDDVKSAKRKLEKTPDDPQANLVVGKYLCFVKGDWDKGAANLALGDNEALKSLAVKELQAPSSNDAQVKLGDGWWDLAEKEKGTDKKRLQARAGYWYKKALPQLSGLSKAKLEMRIQQLTPKDSDSTSVTANNSGKKLLKIVLWNQHNGFWNNAGTDSCNLILLSKTGEVLWRKDGITVPWAPGQDAFATVDANVVVSRLSTLRVELPPSNRSGGFSEIEVYNGKVNIALGCSATASSSDGIRTADKLTDGITSSAQENVGYWLLSGTDGGWAEISLDKKNPRPTATKSTNHTKNKKRTTPSPY